MMYNIDEQKTHKPWMFYIHIHTKKTHINHLQCGELPNSIIIFLSSQSLILFFCLINMMKIEEMVVFVFLHANTVT